MPSNLGFGLLFPDLLQSGKQTLDGLASVWVPVVTHLPLNTAQLGHLLVSFGTLCFHFAPFSEFLNPPSSFFNDPLFMCVCIPKVYFVDFESYFIVARKIM